MGDILILWIHLLAVTIWIGPQVFMFTAAIPAIRTVEDAATRARVLRIMVTRFGTISGIALVVIVITGIINLYQIDGYSAKELINGDAGLRFTRLFWEKMVLVALAVVLVGLHTMVIGPRQLQLAEQMTADPAEQRNLRRLSIMLSGIGLLASIGALYMGAALGRHEYSLVSD